MGTRDSLQVGFLAVRFPSQQIIGDYVDGDARREDENEVKRSNNKHEKKVRTVSSCSNYRSFRTSFDTKTHPFSEPAQDRCQTKKSEI
jgi:hypothetical protein